MIKKYLLLILISILFYTYASAQILCISCYNQNDSIPYIGPNLILNGSFETSPCIPDAYTSSSWCPLATAYGCDIPNWTSMGGGSATYCCIVDNNGWSNVGSGLYAVYFGNSFCNICSSNLGDTSCLIDYGCTTGGVPAGYPYNGSQYGGTEGISLYQVVTGLTVGNNYTLQFWVGGEEGFMGAGLFGLNVGFGDTMLRDYQTPPNTGIGTRFLVEFKANSTSDTIKFTNWGHITYSNTELVLDDVSLYSAPQDSIPHSGFSAGPTSGCVPLTVTFVDSSSTGDTYLWNFGDGNTSTLYNPVHTYTDTGTFTVTLVVINNTPCSSGADTTIRVNYITVGPAPTTAFTADTLNGCDSLTVHFTNNSINAISYLWNFGDGNTSILTNPVHTYTTVGTFTVTLVGYGSGVCNDTALQTITISGPPVVTSAFVSDTISHCDSVTVNFTNNSINGMTYHWNFGDGNTSNASNPSHTYTTTGTYTVKLIAYNTGICGTFADSITHVINIIINLPAIAIIASPDSLTSCDSASFTFTNNSTNAVSSFWSFGDGNTSTTINPTHYYSTSGTYTVTLIAFGAGGCNDTVSKQIIVNILHPTVSSGFSADTIHGCSPFTVHFTNSSTSGTSYLWNFGDGNTSASTNPSHTYTTSGTFTVTLLTYNNSPCGLLEDSSKLTYIIVDMPIQDTSKFTEENITGCVPLSVTFTNSSVNATSYLWTFGDGWIDSTKNPTHTYIDTGTFIVTLITFNSDTLCRNKPDTSTFEYVVADSCNIYIPNVFSPNGDGKNEYFYLNAEGYSNYHLIIFNRWGLKLFESNDAKVLWNGKINNNGADAPDGTYYYIFTAIDFNSKPYSTHGSLTLIR